MNKNDILRLEVEDMNNLGNGIAHVDGFAVFVVGGVTGDIMLAMCECRLDNSLVKRKHTRRR